MLLQRYLSLRGARRLYLSKYGIYVICTNILRRITFSWKRVVKYVLCCYTDLGFKFAIDSLRRPKENTIYINYLENSFLPLLYLQEREDFVNSKLSQIPYKDIFVKPQFWHTDPFSNYKYSVLPVPCMAYVFSGLTDCVPVWQLSRLSNIVILGSRERFCSDGISMLSVIDNWNKHNPYYIGINWMIPMESALRALSILPSLWSNYERTNVVTIKLIWLLVFDTKRRTSLDRNIGGNNHLLIELIVIIILLPIFQTKSNDIVCLQAAEKLLLQLDQQFNNEGFLDEASYSYNALSLEGLILLFTITSNSEYHKKILGRNYFTFSRKLFEFLRKSILIVQAYMEIYGEAPNIGDSADMRVIKDDKASLFKANNHNYIIQRAKNCNVIDTVCLEQEQLEHCFPNTGIAFLKTSNYCISLNSISNHNNKSGHSHFDKTSWTLKVNNQSIFIDSGTWMYTMNLEKRNYYRSANAHNVLLIDDSDQAELSPGAFGKFKIECGISRISACQYKMWHSGYKMLVNVGKVEREIFCSDSKIVVNETVNGSGFRNIKVNYIVAPNADVTCAGNVGIIQLLQNKIKLIADQVVSIENGVYSEKYGHEQACKKIVIDYGRQSLPFATSYEIHILSE